jgi:SRSO17 transposase
MIRVFFLLLFGVTILFAGGSIVSSIPLPKTYVQNLDPYDCDSQCLADLIAKEKVFSFLAQMPESGDDATLNEQRLIYVSLFNLDSGDQGSGIRIAMLLPERIIGHYAVSTTNSVMAYLLGKNRNFQLQTFQTGDESPQALENGLQRLKHAGFRYVIAPLTKNGVQTVISLHPDANIYFPTVNVDDVNMTDVNVTKSRFYFGGIDYRAQVKMLMSRAELPLVIFYDTSELGRQLKDMQLNAFLQRYDESSPEDARLALKQIFAYPVDKQTTNLKGILKNNEKIQHGSFFLDTPLIKTGMIMSQLTLYDVNASQLLSTQINYDAMLFDITQEQDRKHMLIANSISEQNSVLVERNKLLQNDIVYDWINYASTLGADYFYHLTTHTPREYNIPFAGHQINYPVRLFRPDGSRFKPVELPDENDSIFSMQDD